ncbi:MAG TPA: hypothetical protein VIK35_09100, partial [Verrucomicrobiae bacterium]
MDNTNLQPTQPEPSPDETVTPEVSFVRGFLGRVSALLRADDDQKAKLTGHARLVLTVLDSSARVYLFKTEYEKLKAWQEKNDALKSVHMAHTNVEADAQFFAQQKNLHSTVTQPGFNHSSILSRDVWREKFQSIRLSASEEQKRLWREHIELCREIARRVAPVLLEQAASLEVSEKERFENFGLPYTGSPFAAACRAAAKFVEARVALSESAEGPSAALPWLL